MLEITAPLIPMRACAFRFLFW